MSLNLRILLILFSVLTAYFVFRKIRKSQMQITDALFWIFFVAILVLLSAFPQIANYVCKWVGVLSPVNFVYLAIIFLLLLKSFNLSVKISNIENKLQNFVQTYALDQAEQEKSKEEMHESKEI